MKAILWIFYFLVINTTIGQNLIQQKNIRLVYPETSIEAVKKIEKYIDSVPETKSKFLNIYSKKIYNSYCQTIRTNSKICRRV
jgi:hypothetical protein